MKRPIAILLFLSAIFFSPLIGLAQNTCASPHAITSLPFSQANLTTCGKVNDYQNLCGENQYMDGEDYIFSYTPATNECISVVLSNTLTYCAVFIFDRCPSTAGAACIARNTPSGGNPSVTGVTLNGGTTYYIMVDTWPSPNCSKFDINVSSCPDGLSCAKPKNIANLPFTETNTTCGAGADFGAFVGTDYAVCGPNFNDDGADFTYAYTPTRNQCINVRLSGIPTHKEDMAVIVTQGCPTNAGSKCLGVSEGSGTAGPADINSLYVFAGSTIYITVDADDAYFSCTPFTLTVDTCPTPLPQCGASPLASDYCSGATAICDFSGYCGSTSNAYSSDQPSNINSIFCGSIENNGWIKFVASSTTASFNILFGNCTNGDGIQVLVMEATNCTNFVAKSNCYEPLTGSGYGVVTATALVPGNTYLMMIDGYAGDHCDYTIQANSGVMLPVDAGPDQTICPGKSATLTASNGNNVYKWNPGNLTTKTITVTPSVTTDYIVESLSGGIGCPSPNYDTVRVNVQPTVTNTKTVVNANTCTGACDGSATLNISGGVTPYTINWSHGPNTSLVNALCPGNTYTVVISDNTGCQSKDTVIMPPAVIANFAFTAPACGSLTTTGNVTASTGTGTFSYTGPGTLTISNTGGLNYSFSANNYGSYDVTWTVSDGSCSKTITKTMVFNQVPTAAFSVSTPACGSKTTSINTMATIGSGNFSFAGPGTLTFSNTGANVYNVTASNYGTYDITWLVDNNGCTASQTKSVTFTAQPIATFSAVDPVCDSLNFTATTTATVGSGVWTYTGPGGAIVTFTTVSTNNYKITASQFGTYTFTWTVTNGVCSASSSQSISFYKKPTPNAGADQNICGLNTTLAAVPSLGTGTWSQSSGPATATFGNLNQFNTSLSTGTYGSYTLIWSELNGNCPAQTDDVVILFSENPTGSAGPDQSLCGLSTSLAGVATIGTGIWSGAGVSSPTNANTTVSSLTEGKVVYTWTITNGACPTVVDDVEIDFHKLPTPNAGADKSVCGLSVSLDAIPSTSSGNWLAVAGISYVSSSNPKTQATAASYGTQTLVWEETNSPCPVITDSVNITFVASPNPNAGPDQSICGLAAVTNAVPSVYSGSWSGTGMFTDPNNPSTDVTSSVYGSAKYVWTEFNAAPCPSKTDTVVFTFIEQPSAEAGPNQTLCGKTTNLAAVRSVSGSIGNWTVPAGVTFSSTTALNPTVTVPSFGQYTFYWTEVNTATCNPSTDSVTVYFVPPTSPYAGIDDNSCGLDYDLAAVPSFGLGTWSYSGPGILNFSSINDPNAHISASTFGKYRLSWTEDNKPCVANTDTVYITFFEPPVVDAGVSPDKVCGLNYALNATPTVGSGKWTWTPDTGVTGTITFKNGNDSIVDAKVSSTEYARFFFIYTVVNGPCTPPADTIDLTFYKRPVPDAGPDIIVCDTLRVQLSGATSVVNAQWKWTSETAGSVTFDPNADISNPIAEASLPGIYKLYFSELNDPVCGTTTDSLTLTFLELPTADAGPDALACGQNYSFAATEPNYGTGHWTFVSSSLGGYSATIDDDTLYNTQATLNTTPPPAGVDLTFVWTIENGNCNPVSDTVVITFKQVPNQVEAGNDQQLCDVLATAISANDNGASGIWSVSSAPAGGIGTFGNTTLENTSFTVNIPGIYIVQRAATVAGCPNQVTDAVTVDFRKMPNPNAGPDGAVCDTICTLQAAPRYGRITGVWKVLSGPGNLVIDDSSKDVTNVYTSNLAYGDYFLIRQESNEGCPDVSDTVKITFNEQTVSNAGPDIEVCDLVYNMQAIPSSGSSSTDYVGEWSLVGGPGTVTMNPFDGRDPITSVTVSNYGEYIFLWTETNGVCPSSTDQVKLLFVNPSKPEAGSNDNICGLVDTLGAIPSYGIGVWVNDPSNPGVVLFTNSSDPKSIVTVSQFGQYRFDWLEANSPCYANSDSTVINFNQQPVASAGSDKDTCSLSAQLNAVPSANGPDYQGTWSGPLGAIFDNPSDPNTVVHIDALGYGTYTFTWLEVNGSKCIASNDDVRITFLETPVANAGNQLIVACGTSVPLNALPSVGQGSWEVLNSSSLSFSNPTAANTAAIADAVGNYQVVWREVNYGYSGGSCSSTDTITINFYPQPNSYAGLDTAVCGNTATINAIQSVSASSITWSVIESPTALIFESPDSASTPITLTGSNYGTYNIVFTESISSGVCTSSDTVKVIFVEMPVANAGIADSVCGLEATLQAVPSVGTGSWKSLSSGVVFNPDLSDANAQISAPDFGSYQLVWTENNGTPCKASQDTVRITFLKLPVPKAGPDFSVCGDQAALNATPGSYPGYWSNNSGQTISFDDPANPSTNATLLPVDHSDYGLINLIYTETNAGVCSSSDDVAVYYSEMPKANAGSDQDLCGLDFILNAIPSVGTGTWDFNGNDTIIRSFSNLNDPKAVGSMNYFGIFNFNWVEINSGCPSDTDITALSFTQPPKSSAGRDTSVCSMSYILQGVRSVGAGLWTKMSGPGTISFDDPTREQATVTVSQQGIYKFIWTEINSAFCPISRDTVQVYFEKKPVPNAGPDLAICGKATNLQASPSVGSGFWSFVGAPGTLTNFGNPNSATSSFASNKYGPHPLIWRETNTAVCAAQYDTMVVTFVQQPTANAGVPSMNICGNNITLKATPSVGVGQWKQVSGPGTGTFANEFLANSFYNIPSDSFGTYTLRWTEFNADPCVASFDDIVITFFKQPEAYAGEPISTCSLGARLDAVPSAGTGGWQLIPAAGQSATFTDPSDPKSDVSVNQYGIYQFAWTETNGNVCPSDFDIVLVNFLKAPQADAGPDQINCGQTGTLASIPSNGIGFWKKAIPNDPVTISDTLDLNSTITASVFGRYAIVWQETNGRECPVSFDTVLVEFAKQPVANPGSNDKICGLDYVLKATPSVGLGTWTTSAPNATFLPSVNDPHATITTDSFGTFDFTWTEVNQSPCVPDSQTISIEFIQGPSANMSIDKTETCAGDPVVLTFNFTGTGPFNVSYTVNGGAPVTATGVNNGYIVSLNPTVSSNYLMTNVTDGSAMACTYSSSTPVTLLVHQLPIAGISGNYAVCELQNLDLPLNLTGTPPFTVTFDNAETKTYNGPGPYFYSFVPGSVTQIGLVSVKDSACPGTVSPILANITTNPLPEGQISRIGNTNLCHGDSTLLQFDFTKGTAPYTVYWKEAGSELTDVISVNPFQIKHRLDTGISVIQLDSLIDANGCVGTGNTLSITVYPLPTATIYGDTLICQESNSSVLFNFGPAGSPGPWVVNYDSAGTVFTTNPITDNAIIELSPADTTTYVFTRITDQTTGCSSQINVPLVVNVVPIPTLLANLTRTDICVNDSSQIIFNYAGVSPFNVTLSNGETYTGLVDGSSIWVVPTGSISYTVTGFSDGSGITCIPTITANLDLTVHQLPPVDFSVNDTSTCKPMIAKFVNTTDPNYIAGTNGTSWVFDEGGTAGTDTVAHPYAQTGTYYVTLNVISNQGCKNSLTRPVVITIYPDPVADFTWTPDVPTVTDNQVNFINESQGSILTQTWNIDGIIYKDFSPSHHFHTSDSGHYPVKLIVESVDHCFDSTEKIIFVKGELNTFVPSAFTPNNDGLNDVFIPSVAGVDPGDYEFLVFDRWGEIIFRSTNPEIGWDGRLKGNMAKNDVYTWKLEFKDKYSVVRYKYSGRVNLIR